MDDFPNSGLIGRIGLHYKLITPAQLEAATRIQGQPGNEGRRLGEILRDLGVVSEDQLDKLLRLQQAHGQQASRSRPRLEPIDAERSPPATPPLRATGAATGWTLDRLLGQVARMGASDIHVHPGAPVMVRIGGRLAPLKMPPLDAAQAEQLVFAALTEAEQGVVRERGEFDLALSLPGIGRFRGNVYRERRGVNGVFRPIAAEPPTLGELGLPNSLAKLSTFHQGLVLLAGPAGSGKSSTMAALVRLINEDRHDHIITIEDPIEFLHASGRCVVNQRQVMRHTESFGSALRAALREDPDVLAIGELRDLETVSLAITAAETGHLVLATLHTGSVVRSISRVIDVFPPSQQSQVRAMVSESLRAVVAQRLVPTVDGKRRVPALELMMMTPAIAHLIREEKLHQVRSAMQTSRALGMCLLDDSLQEHVRDGTVSKEAARRVADDPKAFS